MGIVFVVLSHAATLLGILALCLGCYRAVVRSASTPEQIIRGMALVAGVFAYLAAKALGVSIPTLLVKTVDDAHWFSLLFLGTLVPSAAGFLLIRYVMACMRKHDVIAVRVMLMVSALALVMFADVYVAAAGEAKLVDLRPLLPNVSFLLTMMCYIVFEYRPREFQQGFGSGADGQTDARSNAA